MSGPKSGEYTVVETSAMDKLLQEIEQRRRAEEQRVESIRREQLASLVQGEAVYKEAFERHEQERLENEREKSASQLQKAQTSLQNAIDANQKNTKVIKVSEVITRESTQQNFSMIQEIRLQLGSELKSFLTDTVSILDLEMVELLQALNQSYTLEEVSDAATQIRSAIAKEYKKINTEKSTAREMLARISNIASTVVHDELRVVIEGKKRLSDSLVDDAEQLLKDAQPDEGKAAQILQNQLEELGYEVGTLEETLFVEGGKVHFRNSQWDENYYMEMDVNPEKHQMDFHMVYAGTGFHTTQQDHTMEDAWCSDFSELQTSLQEHGIGIKVKHHLGAGEIPVHVVGSDVIDKEVKSKKGTVKRRKKVQGKRIEE